MDTSAASRTPTRSRDAGPAVALVGWLSAALAAGAVLLAVGPLGLSLPLLSALGPGGDRAVVPAAAAFSVLAALATAVSRGAFRRRPWAWGVGVVVHALTVLGAATPFRGVVSGAAVLLGCAALAALLSPGGRAGLLRGADAAEKDRAQDPPAERQDR